MRSLVKDFYTFLIRTQAAYGLAFALIFLFLLPSTLSRGDAVGLPLIASLVAIGFAALVLLPRAAPLWLEQPNRPRHLLPMLSGLVIVPMVLAYLVIESVTSLGLPGPLSANAARLACLPSMALSALLWLATVTLCLWPQPRRNAPRRIRHAIAAE